MSADDYCGRLLRHHVDTRTGVEGWRCVTCGTSYHRPPGGGEIKCNGVEIGTCPWCGPDSPAAASARGDHLRAERRSR